MYVTMCVYARGCMCMYVCVFVYTCPIICAFDVCMHEGLFVIYRVTIGIELTCTLGARCGAKRRHAQPVAKKLSKATPRVKMTTEIVDSCNWIECDRIPWGCAVN